MNISFTEKNFAVGNQFEFKFVVYGLLGGWFPKLI